MKEKLLKLKEIVKNNKKASIIVICMILFVVILSSGVYINHQNDIKKYKQFCYEYQQISDNIDENLVSYTVHTLDAQTYFLEHYGERIYSNNKCFDDVLKDSKDYYDNVRQLKKLEVPEELKNDYKELLETYLNIVDVQEKINTTMIDKNKINLDYSFTSANDKLRDLDKSFNDKMKEKGIKW